MPAISIWMIRLSLAYLLAGTLFGSAMLVNKAYLIHPAIWILLPVHIEFLIFGWIIQLTLGVAYWILPRFIGKAPRGNDIHAALMLILLNAGIFMISTSHILLIPDVYALIGRILQAAAVVIFVFLHWGRVVSYRNL